MTGKVALITGSGRERVGNIIAKALAESGYAIAIHYHSSDAEASDTVRHLRGMGVDSAAFRADVTVEADVDSMFESVIQHFGRLDVLVTTASIWQSQSLEKTTAEDLRRNFDVNTLGTFLCARRGGFIMSEQPEGGVIVTIGDWAITRPYLDHSAYLISKGAIPTLTKALAVELAHRNPKVRVNCIHPGPVMFPPDCGEQEKQRLIDSTLVKSADDPRAVALAVQFLIDNSFVTGTCLPVDGGRSIFASESETRQRAVEPG